VQAQSAVTTFLFTDIEGSSRLWEEQPERMRLALARHDALVRAAVESNLLAEGATISEDEACRLALKD
jgi:class 3 adenylate cyclase